MSCSRCAVAYQSICQFLPKKNWIHFVEHMRRYWLQFFVYWRNWNQSQNMQNVKTKKRQESYTGSSVCGLATIIRHTPYTHTLPQRPHDVIITSLLRQNDAVTSFWRNNDVMCPLGPVNQLFTSIILFMKMIWYVMQWTRIAHDDGLVLQHQSISDDNADQHASKRFQWLMG